MKIDNIAHRYSYAEFTRNDASCWHHFEFFQNAASDNVDSYGHAAAGIRHFLNVCDRLFGDIGASRARSYDAFYDVTSDDTSLIRRRIGRNPSDHYPFILKTVRVLSKTVRSGRDTRTENNHI